MEKKIIIGAYTNNDRKKFKHNLKKEVIFISTHKPYEDQIITREKYQILISIKTINKF